MKLTEEQKQKLIKAVEDLNTSTFWLAEEKAVFDWQEGDDLWQLQVKITRDEDDYMELDKDAPI